MRERRSERGGKISSRHYVKGNRAKASARGGGVVGGFDFECEKKHSRQSLIREGITRAHQREREGEKEREREAIVYDNASLLEGRRRRRRRWLPSAKVKLNAGELRVRILRRV